MEQLCDLHTHSHFSDGTLSPTQLVRLAEETGLSAVALCDHNTVLGLPEFMAAGQESLVETVPGIEFSTDYRGTELHMLALFVQSRHYPVITEMMEEGRRQKEKSNQDLIEALAKAGYVLDYNKVKEKGRGRINRAHVAAALTEAGYTESVQDAFSRLLSPKHGYYHPPALPNVFDIIRFTRSIGAVPVLAHPFLNLKTEEALTEFLAQAVPAGLVGMETMYPKFTPEQTETARILADRFGLLPSGGSDFHGDNKPDTRMGIGRGSLRVPAALLEALRKK